MFKYISNLPLLLLLCINNNNTHAHTQTLIYSLASTTYLIDIIFATLLIVYNGMCVGYCFIFCTKNFGFVHVGLF